MERKRKRNKRERERNVFQGQAGRRRVGRKLGILGGRKCTLVIHGMAENPSRTTL